MLPEDQTPKQSPLTTILSIAGMVAAIFILTKVGLPSWAAIGIPIFILVVISGIKQSVDTKKAKTSISSTVSAENASVIRTAKQLNIIEIDNKSLFTDNIKVAAGEHVISLRHERLVLTTMVATTINNITVKTIAGQELAITWQYKDDNYIQEGPVAILLNYDYQPINS